MDNTVQTVAKLAKSTILSPCLVARDFVGWDSALAHSSIEAKRALPGVVAAAVERGDLEDDPADLQRLEPVLP